MDVIQHHGVVKGQVSVVIPCYNNEQYVADAIESALNQTYDHIEVVVVDDGSTDESLSVIEEYDSETLWRTQENRGAPVARNKGLSLAYGQFVKFLDADDILVRDAIEAQMSAAQSADEGTIVCGDWGAMDSDGENRQTGYYPFPKQREPSICHLLRSNIQTMSPLHRRAHLERVGGFDERFSTRGQEYQLHFRLTLEGHTFQYVDHVVGYARQHESPSRIGNRSPFRDDPTRGLWKTRERHRMITEKMGSEAPDCAFSALARGAWRSGRKALRIGRPDIADQYFELARSIDPENCVNGSEGYRTLVSLLGARTAERVVDTKETIMETITR